jgi:hypothetical protein
MPVAGKVLVRVGQKVGATDTIAESNLNPEYLLLDIARGLGVSADQADRYIQCQVSDQLAEKDPRWSSGSGAPIVQRPALARLLSLEMGRSCWKSAASPFN